MVLQEIASEDSICLRRRTPFQQDRVFLGAVDIQDGHLCWNYSNYNHNNKISSNAHLKLVLLSLFQADTELFSHAELPL